MTGNLVVIATPIGNLGDLSPRAAEALRDADLVACEDTRRTATLLRAAGSEAPMVPSHQHNEAARAADLVERMRAGARVALVSDAGMPAVSDPGRRVVAAAVDAGIPVTVVPGAGAVETALVASGLAAESGYVFAGFVPRKGEDRTRLLHEIANAARPVVVFESPRRLRALLRDLDEMDPARPVAVCRELTKLHEEVARGTAAVLLQHFPEPPRGEVVVVVAPSQTPRGPDVDGVTDTVALLLDAGLGPKDTAAAVAALGLGSRNAAYEAALTAAASRRST
jgi:16S rRNA (cytidine1402-2'-O)-methyltransferase